jgi:peptide/nickel transport system substrate-binding protein
MKSLRWVLIALMCVTAFGLTGLAQETPKDGGTLILWMSAAPNTFLGYYSFGDQARFPCDLIFDQLYDADPTGEFIPRLASGFDLSADGLTYTFYLNPDALWQDGEAVTAEDVKFTIELLGHPEYTGSNASDVLAIAGAETYQAGEADEISGAVVIDDLTVQITLKELDVSWFELFATELWILPEHLLADEEVASLDQSTYAMSPIGSGPFKFVQYFNGDYAEFERNENYHLGRPHLDSIIIRIMDPQAAVAAMETGEVDACMNYKVAVLPADALARLQENPDVEVAVFPTDSFEFMAMNLTKAPMNNVKFRQALSYAINREAMVQAALAGFGVPGYSMLMPGSPYDNGDVNRYEYNPDKARELLAEINWDSNTKIVFGSPNQPQRSIIAAMLQQDFEAIGVNLDIEVYDFGTMYAKANDGDFDIWHLGWGSGGVQYPGYTYFNMLHSTQWPPLWNFSRYNNPTVDTLLELAPTITDRASGITVYHQLHEIVSEELPYIILMNKSGYSARSVRVHNFEDFIGGTTYNAHQWWVD